MAAEGTILYITGSGRSGSTVLEMYLAESPHVVAVGEMRHIFGVGYRRNQMCACGRPFAECDFWRDVDHSAFEGGLDAVEREKIEQDLRSAVRLRRLPQLLAGSPSDRGEVARVALRCLYRGAVSSTSADIVVDSSKSPLHCLFLLGCRDLDIRVLHLVRDSRAVAFSWGRSKRWLGDPSDPSALMRRHSVAKSCSDWVLANLLATLCRLRAGHAVLVRYEEFTASPQSVIDQALLKLELAPIQHDVEHAGPGRGQHSVMGNPVRFSTGQLRIERDTSWEDLMSRADRRMATVLTAPMLALLGYRRRRAIG